MKKLLIVAIIAAMITIPMVGCGGGSSSESTETQAPESTSTSTTASASTPATTTATSTEGITPKSDVPRDLEYTKGSLPKVFEKAVYDSSVTVVFLYDPNETISSKVAEKVEEVVSSPDYADQITYLNYEISGKTTSSIAKLTTALGAKYLPHISIVDGNNKIVFEDSGFTDTDYFEHALYNVVYKDDK